MRTDGWLIAVLVAVGGSAGCGTSKPPATAVKSEAICGDPVSGERASDIALTEAKRLVRARFGSDREGHAFPQRNGDAWVVAVDFSDPKGKDTTSASVRIDGCSGSIITSSLSGGN